MTPQIIMPMSTADIRPISGITGTIVPSKRSAAVQMWMIMTGQERCWPPALITRQKNQHGFMDGLSLHYYVHPGGWEGKGQRYRFLMRRAWYKTLHKALYMKELIEKHAAIMDEYDPEKKIGMIVDEWGAWYDVEPGTNPGFLYQQNTMRDALVAGITLNIFNKHSDRVKMANLAQIVNVLQSVILTEGDKMVKTPTWQVFRIYRDHQDADLVESSLETRPIGVTAEESVPNLTESVSVDKNGVMHITVTNLSVDESYDIDAEITGCEAKEVTGEIVTGEMTAKNTFEEPDVVKAESFDGAQLTEKGLKFTIPACSVVHLAVR